MKTQYEKKIVPVEANFLTDFLQRHIVIQKFTGGLNGRYNPIDQKAERTEHR